MESTRQKKFSRLIQKELSDIFQRDARELVSGHLATITVVRVSPDLSIAKVYLSFLPQQGRQEKMDLLRDNTKNIRQLLGNRVRHQVRIVPELHFYLDDTEEEAARIDKLMQGLHIPPVPPEDQD